MGQVSAEKVMVPPDVCQVDRIEPMVARSYRIYDAGSVAPLSRGVVESESMSAPAVGGSPHRSRMSVERRALRDGVYDAILEMLLDNGVAPGESLSIDGLARELGVSPTPVREALGQLEHTGLVTRAALKGYRTAPPLSQARMNELLTARSVVEVAAARAAVPVSDAVLAELETAHDAHALSARRVQRWSDRHPGKMDWSTMRKYYNVDWDFHLVLLRNCGNHYLLDMAEDLAPHVHRLRQSMTYGTNDVEEAHAEHQAILDAVRAADPDRAADAMEAHLQAVKERACAEC
jgi:DNA-binding GntR family transcriptional regulator